MAKVIRFLNLILVFVLIGCAGQIPPSGGPVDTSPPQIIFSSPEQKELNFNLQKIILRFDKYMSQRSVESAIYFPPFNASDMNFDWSGTTLDISLHKPLQSDRTYILTLGATALDLRGNYFGKSFNLVFSTGAQIDTGSVSGRVYAAKLQPYTVAAFPITGDIDTLKPFTDLAKYVTQSDDSGRYVLQGLADGKYRLICFDDQMRNFTYAPQMDVYSSATHDIEISKEAEVVNDVNFIPAIEDTTPPQLYSADLANDGLVVLKFSEPIDSSGIKASDFVVRDSATSKIFPVDFAVRLEKEKYEIVLRMQSPLPLKREYLVTATDGVKDLQQNRMSSNNNTVVMKADSAVIQLSPYYFNFADSLQKITTYDTLFCQFISPTMHQDSGGAKVSLYDSSGNDVSRFVKRESATIFKVVATGLNSLEWYTLKLNYGTGMNGGLKDSVVARHFRTIDFLTLGDIEGKVSPVILKKKIIVVAMRPDGKRFYTFAGEDGKFKLDGILAGDYTVRAYAQHDSGMGYFSGRSYPYQFAEPFGVYSEPVKVRPRWTTEGVAIRLY